MPSSSSGKPNVSRSAPVSRVGAHQAEDQPQHGHRNALERRAASQRRACEQAQQHQRADLRRAELQGDLHQQRGEEHHLGDAPGCADERADDGDAERDAALALLRHREAIKTCHSMRRMARQVEKDRADRAAILRPVENAREHQDRADRLDAERQRQKDRNGRERAHARQHADHVADQHAEEAVHQVVRLDRDREPVPKILESGFHQNRLHPCH